MRRNVRFVPLVAVLALGLLSYGAAAGTDRRSDRAEALASSRATLAKCADTAKLSDAVLTVADMPTGFGEVSLLNSETTVRLGGGNLSSDNVPFRIAAGPLSRGFEQITQSLSASSSVSDTAILLKSAKDAPKLVKAFRKASAADQTWDQSRTEPASETVTYTSSTLSFPNVGDERLALRLRAKVRLHGSTTELNGGTFDYVLWRRGPVVSIVVGQSVDMFAYAKRADLKVAAILRLCPKKSK